MNVGIGTVAAQLLFWEYFFSISGIVSLQCGRNLFKKGSTFCSGPKNELKAMKDCHVIKIYRGECLTCTLQVIRVSPTGIFSVFFIYIFNFVVKIT